MLLIFRWLKPCGSSQRHVGCCNTHTTIEQHCSLSPVTCMADETLRGSGLDVCRLCSGTFLSVRQGILVNLGEKDDNKRKKAATLKCTQQGTEGTVKKRSTMLAGCGKRAPFTATSHATLKGASHRANSHCVHQKPSRGRCTREPSTLQTVCSCSASSGAFDNGRQPRQSSLRRILAESAKRALSHMSPVLQKTCQPVSRLQRHARPFLCLQ